MRLQLYQNLNFVVDLVLRIFVGGDKTFECKHLLCVKITHFENKAETSWQAAQQKKVKAKNQSIVISCYVSNFSSKVRSASRDLPSAITRSTRNRCPLRSTVCPTNALSVLGPLWSFSVELEAQLELMLPSADLKKSLISDRGRTEIPDADQPAGTSEGS